MDADYQKGDDDINTGSAQEFESESSPSPIIVELITYGKRHGKPGNLDHYWNCTTIPNPSTTARKGRTGRDKRLRTEVMKEEKAQEIVTLAVEDLQERIASLKAHDKTETETGRGDGIYIGFGCACGKHRSVSVAIKVHEILRQMKLVNVAVKVTHRDIER